MKTREKTNQKETNTDFLKNVRWDSNGLVPCIMQDAKDNAVLMVAYMNRESLQKTLQTKKSHFWSRSRQKLWFKGEESGNVQLVKKIYIDCDGDCILIKIKQIGNAACHTGMRSCFYRQVDDRKRLVVVGKKMFDPDKVYKKS